MSERIRNTRKKRISLNSRPVIASIMVSMGVMMTVSFMALLNLVK
ncbi:MAG: hypothetical protein ACM3JQ_01985 [Candidatus Eiseniibacteriota bacterium]